MAGIGQDLRLETKQRKKRQGLVSLTPALQDVGGWMWVDGCGAEQDQTARPSLPLILKLQDPRVTVKGPCNKSILARWTVSFPQPPPDLDGP